ncbi:lysylphosphatidylglycerol synthase transmembrane domain-containing protein [Pseudoxanthomonas suwonensis]|uniref:Flippase-like domain-containing protein n=1 Tax=Pseudoxanthomonas suwonensis TaxID=314722 RepID=A0A0E3UNJ2_9GAMM|nr:lysylphosphatidylglycerol synthase transmembrane domain-containing protein [Pseudoxanthomonas suwonensis]AKC87221.1 hypothetical protein WQ53_11175 [Pseudoxanthomonas suwonensis]
MIQNEESQDRKKRTRTLRIPWAGLLKVAVSLGLIVALVAWVDWPSALRAMSKASPGELLIGFLCIVPTVVLAAWRWSLCARASSIRMPMMFYVKATYAALFVGQFLPAGVGVDAARLGYFMHGRARLSHALQSLLLDRLAGVTSVVFVMAIGLPFIWADLPPLLRAVGISLVIATASGLSLILVLDRIPWLARYGGTGKRRKLIDVAFGVKRTIASRETAGAFLTSCLIYCLMILGVVWIGRSLGYDVPYLSLLAIVAMAVFVSLLPISVNGWGVREGAMVAGLAVLGVSKEAALGTSLLFGFANAVVTIPGAFLWYLRRKHESIDPR